MFILESSGNGIIISNWSCLEIYKSESSFSKDIPDPCSCGQAGSHRVPFPLFIQTIFFRVVRVVGETPINWRGKGVRAVLDLIG